METMPLLIAVYVALTRVPSFAEELKLVQILFRHGDRTPTQESNEWYPLDPYINETWFPEGWGGLTNAGRSNARELGLFLKEKYGKLLGDVHSKDRVVFRSSRAERVIMTAEIVAAALFPPSEIQRSNSTVVLQPVVIPADLSTQRYFYENTLHCQKYRSMKRELERTDEFLLNRTAGLTEFVDFVNTNLGRENDLEGVAYIYHRLYAELGKNLELPEWTRGIFPEGELERITSYHYIIQSYNKSLIQLNGGPWIREWLENVDSYLNGTRSENPIGLFYGGHEVNVAAVLAALGVFEQHVPFYCSAVMFELLEVEGQPYVKVLYRNKRILQELLIPGCGSPMCPLQTFRQLFADIITVDDMAAVCQQN